MDLITIDTKMPNTIDAPTIDAPTIDAPTIDAQVFALKQSFTIKTENNLRFVCYNNMVIGQIIEIFTVEFVYYHAPTMIRLFPSIFESKYFSESLNFYIYKSSTNNELTCEQLNGEQLNGEQLTIMLYELR